MAGQPNYTIKLTLSQAAYIRKLVDADHWQQQIESAIRGVKHADIPEDIKTDYAANEQLRQML